MSKKMKFYEHLLTLFSIYIYKLHYVGPTKNRGIAHL